MAGKWERTYGFLFKSMIFAVNPIKSAITQPHCIIHQFINWKALDILKNDQYLDVYSFFSDYIISLNEGVVWADQDMKSSGHFYHPEKERGLFGNNDALSLAVDYYKKALENWNDDNTSKAIFYLGACVHLVQDVSVPQHANNRLLDDHRKYEMFVRRIYSHSAPYHANKGIYHIDTIEEAVRCSARISMKVYSRLKDIKDDDKRFYSMTKFLLPLAQRTTAGCLLKFYRDIGKLNRSSLKAEVIN